MHFHCDFKGYHILILENQLEVGSHVLYAFFDSMKITKHGGLHFAHLFGLLLF